MEGLPRRSVPPVERSFVSSRLAEDLLASVYERLLGTAGGRKKVSGQARDDGDQSTEQEALETLATGGRS